MRPEVWTTVSGKWRAVLRSPQGARMCPRFNFSGYANALTAAQDFWGAQYVIRVCRVRDKLSDWLVKHAFDPQVPTNIVHDEIELTLDDPPAFDLSDGYEIIVPGMTEDRLRDFFMPRPLWAGVTVPDYLPENLK